MTKNEPAWLRLHEIADGDRDKMTDLLLEVASSAAAYLDRESNANYEALAKALHIAGYKPEQPL